MPTGTGTIEDVQNPETLRQQYAEWEREYHEEIAVCTRQIEAYQKGIKAERDCIAINIAVLNNGQSEKKYGVNEDIKFQSGIELRKTSLKEEVVLSAEQKQVSKKYSIDPAAFCEEIQESIDKIERYHGYILGLHSRKVAAENALERLSFERKQLDESEVRKTAFELLRNMLGM